MTTVNRIKKSYSLRKLTQVTTLLALLGTVSIDGHALALGRAAVISALGEPLRAEIDVPDINSDEAGSLRATVGNVDAFRRAGLEFNSLVAGVQITLQKRPDGRSYLQLSGERPINEPYLDLVIETNWGAGKLVRDYTLLFDPPVTKSSMKLAPVQLTPVQFAPASTAIVTESRSVDAPSPVASTNATISGGNASNASEKTPAAARVAASKTGVVKTVVTPRAVVESTKPATQPFTTVVAVPVPIGAKQVTVRAGDNASRIATAEKPQAVSLDQMLVALLQANPEAFGAGNINRLKAGSVLSIPDADAAGATPPVDASKTIVAQSRDFNEFRRKLADGVQVAQIDAPKRVTTGKVQANLDDKKATNASPDKLSLKKGELAGKASKEEKLAKSLQAKDEAKRVAELNKNIAELQKLSSLPSATVVPAVVTAASAGASRKASVPGISVAANTVTATTPTVASAPIASASAASATKVAAGSATIPATASKTLASPADLASGPATKTQTSTVTASATSNLATTLPATAASSVALGSATTAIGASALAPIASSVASAVTAATAASAPVKLADPATPTPAVPITTVVTKPVIVDPPVEEVSFLSELLDNPLIPSLAGGLVAILAGLGLYRVYQRKKSGQVDSSFMESRLQPDSFFGASGGQKIDTDEAALSGSSMMYSPSQLDAGADVDPVAEADVYLAYGRDLQAEEILKEALRSNPSRAAIHFKLLQIYAKRPDVKGYAVTAADAYKLTSGLGAEWAQACEVGREIDPTNPLYHGDGVSSFADIAASDAMHLRGNDQSFASTDISAASVETPAVNSGFGLDLDLDLDFSDSSSAPASSPDFSTPQTIAMTPHSTPSALVVPDLPSLDLDFEAPRAGSFSHQTSAIATVALKATGTSHQSTAPAVDAHILQFDSSDFEVDPPRAASPLSHGGARDDLLEFDLNSLSLDLDDHQPSIQATTHNSTHDRTSSGGSSSKSTSPSPNDSEASNDPLATKMALAEEFQAIGDDDGARALAQEVADGATGNLKAKAKRFLTELG